MAQWYKVICIALVSTALNNLSYAQGAGDAADHRVASYHAGLFHPNGVDLAGYSVEWRSPRVFHWFYTLGFPSLAAGGLSYYQDYQGNGTVATAGIGIGSVAYASLSYQWRLGDRQYIKTGLGLTGSIVYSGVLPVLSYERRLE